MADGVGTYVWIAHYPGNSSNVSVTSLCSDATERATLVSASQADSLIRRPGGVLKGNDIYNGDAAGQSIYGGSYRAGAVRWAYLYVQNDGILPTAYSFTAAGDPVTGFVVTYSRTSGQDITAQVEAGTYTTSAIAPGTRDAIRARIEITNAAAHGASLSRLITATATGGSFEADTVGFTLRRR